MTCWPSWPGSWSLTQVETLSLCRQLRPSFANLNTQVSSGQCSLPASPSSDRIARLACSSSLGLPPSLPSVPAPGHFFPSTRLAERSLNSLGRHPAAQISNSDKWPLRIQRLLPLSEGCALIVPRNLRMMLAGDVNVRHNQGLGHGQYTRNLVR